MATGWMIYGAYGYTGRLIAIEAVRRGHRPLLAGRSAERLAPLAARLGVDWLVVDLEDRPALAAAVRRVSLVYHAAGPFVRTGQPMLDACLAAGAHYLDLSGEIPVHQNTFAHDAAARQAGVLLVSGAGFDVVPSDCLARYVVDQVPGAHSLDIAMTYTTWPTAGTALSALEMLPGGGLVRRAGRLLPWPLASDGLTVHFPIGERRVVCVPIADLETAYRSTGVPNITTYLAVAGLPAPILPAAAAVAGRLLSVGAVRRWSGWWVNRLARGPSASMRQRGRAYLWARARDLQGVEAQAWLITPEPYQFTALAAVRCVEHILGSPALAAAERAEPAGASLAGALTPAQAFGPDFVMQIPGVFRRQRA